MFTLSKEQACQWYEQNLAKEDVIRLSYHRWGRKFSRRIKVPGAGERVRGNPTTIVRAPIKLPSYTITACMLMTSSHAGSVIATSTSVRPCEQLSSGLCSGILNSCSYSLYSPSAIGFPKFCLMFVCRSLYLLPSVAGWSLSYNYRARKKSCNRL